MVSQAGKEAEPRSPVDVSREMQTGHRSGRMGTLSHPTFALCFLQKWETDPEIDLV